MISKTVRQFPRHMERSLFTSFPKDDGEMVPMSSSQVNQSIQRIWKMGPVEKKITCTKIRKSTATFVRNAKPESRERLSEFMTHAPTTQDKYYNLFNRRESAVPMAQLICSVMDYRSDVSKSVHWLKTTDETTHFDKRPIELDRHCKPDENNVSKKNPSEFSDSPMDETEAGSGDDTHTRDDYYVPDVPDGDSNDDTEEYLPLSPLYSQEIVSEDEEEKLMSHGRRGFTDEEAALILDICRGVLSAADNSITQSEVMEALNNDPRSKTLLAKLEKRYGKIHRKKIVDRVRCELRKRKKKT